MTLELTINGVSHSVDASPYRRLLDILREELELTGTKEGCGEGECGACSVLLDGRLVNSCLIPAAQAVGHDITTIEGLAPPADRQLTRMRHFVTASRQLASTGGGREIRSTLLHDVQRALVQFGGTQCGICTPGIALAAANAIEREPDATRSRLRELIAGNLCRCTGYQLIIDAVVDAASKAPS